MTNTIAKATSKQNIIYLKGTPIVVSKTLYNHLERRIARRGMGETVSEYVNLLSRWSIVEGDR
ncbi:MAG TPA: hypothetical protein VH796_03795 [Nitrososphaeraceae archaeon]|jgi:hypothetical protein